MVEAMGRPAFKAEFTMGQLDYQRYHEMLKVMDELSIRVNMLDVDSFIPFYSVLFELYKNFRSILYPAIRKKFEEKFAFIADNIYKEVEYVEKRKGKENISKKLFNSLNEVQMDLLEIKQIIGLGMIVTRDRSFKSKLKKALGV